MNQKLGKGKKSNILKICNSNTNPEVLTKFTFFRLIDLMYLGEVVIENESEFFAVQNRIDEYFKPGMMEVTMNTNR